MLPFGRVTTGVRSARTARAHGGEASHDAVKKVGRMERNAHANLFSVAQQCVKAINVHVSELPTQLPAPCLLPTREPVSVKIVVACFRPGD